MTQSFKVELLHGLLEAGRRHTLAELREPLGRDEAMLAEIGTGATPAERVSALIASLVLRIGAMATPAMDRVLELTAGDRERLLLALCARLRGPDIDLVTTCPSCHGQVEVPVRFDEVISSRPSATEPRIDLGTGRQPWSARLRPPTGADLERAARGGRAAVSELIVNCIEELTGPSGDHVARDELPAEFESDVADALLALDPAAEARVAIACPSCSSPIDALLDAYAILKEGFGGSRRIYDEVYRMARAYHWSETEILALPLSRRRHYLAIAEGGEVRP